MVTSSAYSMSLPAGTPVAMRVMRIAWPERVRECRAVASQLAVASPSRVGLVARMTSSMPPCSTREIRLAVRSWSGPTPWSGESVPWRTW